MTNILAIAQKEIRSYFASPIAYIQFGDGPGTYADPNYRRIVANAIRWAADPATTRER